MAQEISSSEDLKIYNNNRHLKIYAGPGAGKTHLLVENIKQLVQHSNKLKSSFRKVLCITYTNVAVEQIQNRLSSFNTNVIVSTIHSFINEYVIKPNQIQLKKIIKEEFGLIINSNKIITSVQEGFSVLSGHQKDDIYDYLEKKYSLIPSNLYKDLSRTKMADIQVDITKLNSKNEITNSKIDLKYDVKKITPEVALALKDYVWGEAGRLSFDEILYFGYKILSEYKLAPHLIRCEFPYILIDEYQDTNPIQNKIVKVLSEKESIVTVIGDVAQSIYSFQGADYKEFHNFALDSALPVQDYVIKGNRRSTQNIIDLINYLRQKDEALNEQTCELNFENKHKVTFLMQKNKTSFSKPLTEILENNSVILCRKWSEVLKYISNVTEEQRKLITDIINAYSFQFRKNLENELLAKREAWIESMIAINELEDSFSRKCIPSAFKVFEKYFEIEPSFRSFSEKNEQLLKKVFMFWEEVNSYINDTILLKDLIIDINNLICELDIPTKGLSFRYPVAGDEDYFEGIYKHIDKLQYSTSKKITNDIFSSNSKFMTIHKAKGAEYDNVLINIEPAARLDSKECTPLNILCNPLIFDKSSADTKNSYEEFTRIVYVAASRAKNKLYIHLYGDEETASNIDHALGDYCKKKGKDKFFDFEYC
ncbi:ATP-dependent helicase [Paenibacillus amylolyticus]|uniref:ATP-dependent helicase n=1 Tax=Paenibacillus amylolyticus TaxID=1451 RepID=UPI00249C0A16|nr:ATP-dependent helicase [Paenibacillus amylolyticus]WFA86040.1 ATP-dependent helicase [Paenibacillus amylolyticus]